MSMLWKSRQVWGTFPDERILKNDDSKKAVCHPRLDPGSEEDTAIKDISEKVGYIWIWTV